MVVLYKKIVFSPFFFFDSGNSINNKSNVVRRNERLEFRVVVSDKIYWRGVYVQYMTIKIRYFSILRYFSDTIYTLYISKM